MIDHSLNQYHPIEVTLPGATLLETIESLGIPQVEVARRTGFTPKHINSIISGKASITPETALRLERVLGVSSHFWLNLEQNYQASVERQREREMIEQRIVTYTKWVAQFPIAAMIRLEWLPKTSDQIDRVRSLLDFFGIASEEQWSWDRVLGTNTAFRQSQALKADKGSVAAWAWKGYSEAQRLVCSQFSATKFKAALNEARNLSRNPLSESWPVLRALCADAGVALLTVPSLPGLHMYGAARWVNPQRAMIQLSFRGKTNDQFWFSFYHEAGHILLHGKTETFIDSVGAQEHTKEENEANAFASDALIPRDQWKSFLASNASFTGKSINSFSVKLGIAPGIVVGRLQKEKLLRYDQFNGLKQHVDLFDLTTH
ncbi:MAG TPA: HigA family addiction module antitoxin [bacterium]|jgi:addiction module HigA family antidote